jgi:acetyl-CoA C-acetyltransferase
VILGCASPSPDEVNIGRVAALRMGCGIKVQGWTVMRNCASGMQAIDSAMANIQCGRSQLVLAGGVDALSRAPLLFSDPMVRWFAGWMGARSLGSAWPCSEVPPRLPGAGDRHHEGPHRPHRRPADGPDRREPGLALRHQPRRDGRLRRRKPPPRGGAQDAGHFAEIVPLIDRDGSVYASDDGLRRDASMAGLAKLKPFFDKKYGRVTPGNSSQITDGAAWLVLASEAAVARHGLTPIGRIVDSQWAGLEPELMGLGPVHAATPILQRHGLGSMTSTCGSSTKPSPPR